MVGHERSAGRKRSGLTFSKVNFGASFDLQENISVGKNWGRSGCEKLLERDTNRSVIKKSEKCSPDTESQRSSTSSSPSPSPSFSKAAQ